MNNKSLIVVSGIIQKKDKYLLVKKKGKFHEGLWFFPGGIVEKNESIDSALKREIKEEVNLDISGIKFIYSTVFKNKASDNYKTFPFVTILLFKCETNGKEVETGDDADDFKWVRLEEMKDYKLRPGGLEVIQEMKKLGLI
ncbi:MAG: NUDIX hydrolase [Candidatus Nealsonbacteria bacterium]